MGDEHFPKVYANAMATTIEALGNDGSDAGLARAQVVHELLLACLAAGMIQQDCRQGHCGFQDPRAGKYRADEFGDDGARGFGLRLKSVVSALGAQLSQGSGQRSRCNYGTALRVAHRIRLNHAVRLIFLRFAYTPPNSGRFPA
jgi:hypothetical protein